MKKLIKEMLERGGLKVVHRPDDPVAEEMLAVYGFMRLGQPKIGEVEQRLSKLAFMRNLRGLLESTEISCALDIGANVGQFGQLLRLLGYKGRIISFEPASNARRKLESLAAQDHDWMVYPCGCGATSSMAKLNVFDTDTFSTIHQVSDSGSKHFGEYLSESSGEVIEVRTLDEILGALYKPGFLPRLLLKTDTQGYDLEVLKGALPSLDSVDLVVTEAAAEAIYEGAPLYDEIFAFLKMHGFVPSGFYPTGHRKDRLVMMEFDAIFVRDDIPPA
jgi:FkbM family methyltransferase